MGPGLIYEEVSEVVLYGTSDCELEPNTENLVRTCLKKWGWRGLGNVTLHQGFHP